jgi:GNAT superfamily N-acetyltransferase
MEVLRLQDAGVARAAGVIARAFHDDPLLVHVFPDTELRAQLAPRMFAAFVRYDHLFGEVEHLPGFTAVASWARPGETQETPAGLEQAGFADLPGAVPLGTLDRVFAFIGSAVASVAPEEHWHLRLLGVEPGLQSGGLGAILVRHGLDRAAATGHPVLLETFSERTVGFYLRNGFELAVEDVESTSGLRFWALRHRIHRRLTGGVSTVSA